MSLTYGFFNSLNGDRKYNAEQMSSIFDGIINDGVFATIGDAFSSKQTTVPSGEVVIGTGRAWFDHTWMYNDSELNVSLEPSGLVYDRYDAIIFDVDHNSEIRRCRILRVEGVEKVNPSYPSMIHEEGHNQYPICYIFRKAKSTVITDEDIITAVGMDTPYVTGILETIGIDNIVSRWEAQWNNWFSTATSSGVSSIDDWMTQQKSNFEEWFRGVSSIMDDTTAGELSRRVKELEDRFTTLAKEYSVYQVIEDSEGDTIVDSANNPIEGRVIYRIL